MPTAKRSISADDTHELHQAHNGGSNQWEEPERKPIVITDDTPPLDAADAMLDVNSYRSQVAILGPLLLRQLPSARFLVWHLYPSGPLVG